MRPIKRGPSPRPSFKHYRDAFPFLAKRLGRYCSYCERAFDPPAIEHMIPKSRRPAFAKRWDNFLLACLNCNPRKGKRRIVLAHYVWPDRDNTFRALNYSPGGLVAVSAEIAADLTLVARVQRTLAVFKLDWNPLDHPNEAEDDQWRRRDDAWQKATHAWDLLDKAKGVSRKAAGLLRQQILSTATSHGYWSVWVTVFRADRPMLKLLFSKAFPGTAGCFDHRYRPTRRRGGAV